MTTSSLHRLVEHVWCVEHLGVALAPCPVDPSPECDGDRDHDTPCRFVPLYIEETDRG